MKKTYQLTLCDDSQHTVNEDEIRHLRGLDYVLQDENYEEGEEGPLSLEFRDPQGVLTGEIFDYLMEFVRYQCTAPAAETIVDPEDIVTFRIVPIEGAAESTGGEATAGSSAAEEAAKGPPWKKESFFKDLPRKFGEPTHTEEQLRAEMKRFFKYDWYVDFIYRMAYKDEHYKWFRYKFMHGIHYADEPVLTKMCMVFLRILTYGKRGYEQLKIFGDVDRLLDPNHPNTLYRPLLTTVQETRYEELHAIVSPFEDFPHEGAKRIPGFHALCTEYDTLRHAVDYKALREEWDEYLIQKAKIVKIQEEVRIEEERAEREERIEEAEEKMREAEEELQELVDTKASDAAIQAAREKHEALIKAFEDVKAAEGPEIERLKKIIAEADAAAEKEKEKEKEAT